MGKIRWLVFVTGSILCVALFQNCSGALLEKGTEESFSMGNWSSLQYSGGCEADLMNLYQSTYFQLFNQKCSQCHTNGPGIGKFGSPDLQISYDAFRTMGRTRLETNTLSEAHRPPSTGAVNQTAVDSYRPQWSLAEAEYQRCVSGQNPDSRNANTQGAILSLHKSDARLLPTAQSQAWVKLQWDLESEIAESALMGKIRLIATIEGRVAQINGVDRGYEFRNPSLRLKETMTAPILVKGLRLSMNSTLLSDVTTYKNIEVSVSSTTDINLLPGAAYAFVFVDPISEVDQFALSFDSMTDAAGVSLRSGQALPQNPTPTPIPGNPTPTPSPAPTPTGPTFTTLTSNNATQGIFRNSCTNCHSATNRAGGLDMTNYNQVNSNSAQVLARMNSTVNPMPPSGLLPIGDRNLIQTWINNGKPR